MNMFRVCSSLLRNEWLIHRHGQHPCNKGGGFQRVLLGRTPKVPRRSFYHQRSSTCGPLEILHRSCRVIVASQGMHHAMLWYKHGFIWMHGFRRRRQKDSAPEAMQQILALSNVPKLSKEKSMVVRCVEKLYSLCCDVVHFIRMSMLFAPLAVSTPWLLAFHYGKEDPWSAFPTWYWDYARWAVTKSSAAVIKFVQWSSTRRDSFPQTYCDRFQFLHAHSPTHALHQTHQTLKDAFGADWRNILTLDETPVGSGCVAQVYRARLKALGEEVAVKVIHPQMKKRIERDFDLMLGLCSVLEAFPFMKWLSVRESINEFYNTMTAQLDLQEEGKNLQRFRENFRGNQAVHFPKPFLHLCTKNVLVESFEDGVPISEYFDDFTGSNPRIATHLAHTSLDTFLRMIFLHNFAHGDLHPGNILVSKTKQISTKHGLVPQLIWIDAGIVTELNAVDQKNLIDLFYEVVRGNGVEVGKIMIDRGPYNDCKDVNGFCAEMDVLVKDAIGKNLNLRQVHVGKLLHRVMSLCCDYKVKIQARYTSIIVSIGVIEGVGRRLDSNLSVLGTALPIIVQSRLSKA